MRHKNESNVINLADAVGKLKGAGDDDFMRMLVKLLSSKSFMNIPDWMTEVVLDDVEPSSFDAVTCYSKLMQMRFKAHHRHHPANILEDLTLEKSVTFTVRKMEYEEEKEKKTVLHNTKGLALKERKSLTVCAANTSSLLAYYVRAKDQDLSERIKAEETNVSLGFRYASGLTSMRSLLRSYEPSSTMARDAIYRTLTLKENSGLNYHLSAVMATKFKEFYVNNDDITKEMEIYYKEANVPEADRLRGALLEGKSPQVASGKDIEVMWRYLDASRSVRGQDSAGCGTLTVGYYWGWEISRAFVKSISMAWDIMSVLDSAEVKTVCMYSQSLPINVMNILVNNGYYVVIVSSNFPVCAKDSKPGVYSATSLPSIFYLDYKFSEPVIRKTWITYSAIPIVFGTNTQFFTYAYICPALMDRTDLGFFPTTMPHQGRVIVSSIVGSKPLAEFIPRCIGANYFRNFYLLHRRGYWRHDGMASFLNMNREMTIPSLTSVKMTKGLLSGISFEDPVPCDVHDDNIKLIVDKADVTKVDLSFRVASWASRISHGQLLTDVAFLKDGIGVPSDMLNFLLPLVKSEDLLKSLGMEKAPFEKEEEQKVETNYATMEGASSSEEDGIMSTNKAALKDVVLPLPNFDDN